MKVAKELTNLKVAKKQSLRTFAEAKVFRLEKKVEGLEAQVKKLAGELSITLAMKEKKK